MERLGRGLAGLIRGLGLEDAARLHGIKARWRELVGGPLSEHLEPGFISGATLHITAGSPLWLQEAGFYREEILKRLLPFGIRDLKFKPGAGIKSGRQKMKAAGRPTETRKQNPPLTGDEIRQVEIAVHPIKDERLKDLCRGIMTQALLREQRRQDICEPGA